MITLTVVLDNIASSAHVDGTHTASYGYKKAADFDNTQYAEWLSDYQINLRDNLVQFSIASPDVTIAVPFSASSNL